ncbi:MAG TPA: DoxX family protein [Candidatus Angelobacter sp.]|nr:DoxX family protein [Candidatus Angelobacter sp.]
METIPRAAGQRIIRDRSSQKSRRGARSNICTKHQKQGQGRKTQESEETMEQKWMLLLGRLLLSVIFIASGLGKLTHFGPTVQGMAEMKIPLPAVALVISLFIEIGGGLMVLTGIGARYAALVMFLWLIPVTLVYHHFWGIPAEQQMAQQVNFLKNVAIMGGLLILASRPGKAEVDG